jgi:hypothetical protein
MKVKDILQALKGHDPETLVYFMEPDYGLYELGVSDSQIKLDDTEWLDEVGLSPQMVIDMRQSKPSNYAYFYQD